MIEVIVRDNSDSGFKSAVNKFIKLCDKDGILKEVRDRRYYKKPSEKIREEIRERERKFRKNKGENTWKRPNYTKKSAWSKTPLKKF